MLNLLVRHVTSRLLTVNPQVSLSQDEGDYRKLIVGHLQFLRGCYLSILSENSFDCST